MMVSEDGFVAGPVGELNWVSWGPEMDVLALALFRRTDLFIAGHSPATIQGLRLPKRDFVRSLNMPIKGSVMMSVSRVKNNIAPTSASDNPWVSA
jgi:hypothetical protein